MSAWSVKIGGVERDLNSPADLGVVGRARLAHRIVHERPSLPPELILEAMSRDEATLEALRAVPVNNLRELIDRWCRELVPFLWHEPYSLGDLDPEVALIEACRAVVQAEGRGIDDGLLDELVRALDAVGRPQSR